MSTASPPQQHNRKPQRSAPQATIESSRQWTAAVGVVVYIGRRLLLGGLVLLAIIYVGQLGLAVASGADFLEAAREAVGQTFAYLAALLHGDLGVTTVATSSNHPIPVSGILPQVMARSLALLAVSLLGATIVGSVMGIRAAIDRHSSRSLHILLLSIIGVSAPSFFVALLLQLAALRWTRVMGSPLVPVGGFGWDSHILLPALVLAARPVAQITRMTFVAVGNALDQDFVRTAVAKGLRPRPILFKHVLRNAAVPVLTTIGLSLRFSLSSLPVVELFFGWPGAGFMLLKAIAAGDAAMVNALLLCFGLIFIVVNLLLELAYRLVDPRLRDLPRQTREQSRINWREGLQGAGRRFRSLFGFGWFAARWEQISGVFSISRWRALSSDRALDRSSGGELVPVESLRRQRLRFSVQNLPLILGLILFATLMAVFLFGPQLSPHSPFTTRGLEFVDGEFLIPPFEPDDIYPWGTDVLGRDIKSLVLAGAQQTLSLAVMVVVVRMFAGLVLGSLAGWFSGRWIDRGIGALAEVLAAFPTLILAMLLILAIGIRGGYRPFLIALSLVGWGEIMQFVRAEVLSIRPRPFIESATAVGADTPRIIGRHVLPNLAPSLISLAALEMGAVLILLGELGFIGMFIGGGAFAELAVDGPKYHYSDVPEWASLLSNVRLYARTYVWTALYPATAFFLSILTFNLLGEGIRRQVETQGFQLSRFWNRYTAVAVVTGLVMIVWINGNTGALAFYRTQAVEFDGEAAFEHVETLSQSAWQGRSLGSDGTTPAAQYVADQFEQVGLQPASMDGTFFQTRLREYQQLDAVPVLEILDEGPQPQFRRDYTEFAGLFRTLGDVEGPVHFLSIGIVPEDRNLYSDQLSHEWRELDLTETVLLVLDPEEMAVYARLMPKGMLVVAEDDNLLRRRDTIPARSPIRPNFLGRKIGQDAPVLWISEQLADRLLAPAGATVDELRVDASRLMPRQVLQLEAGSSVHMAVEGTVHDDVEVVHVIGQLPAVEGQQIGDRLIVVMAQIDAPPLSPDSVTYAGANDNASGVALMLEAIRTMQETGYDPYKTFLFVAYSGEGDDDGVPVNPRDLRKFLNSRLAIDKNFEVEAIIDLRGVGGAAGGPLELDASGSLRLVDLFAKSAKRAGVRTIRDGDKVDISVVFDRSKTLRGGEQAPYVGVHWAGWEATSRTAEDTLDGVSAETLSRAGRAVTLALMALGREDDY